MVSIVFNIGTAAVEKSSVVASWRGNSRAMTLEAVGHFFSTAAFPLRQFGRITRQKSTKGPEVHRTASRSRKQPSWTIKVDGTTYHSSWLVSTSSGLSTGRVGCLTSQASWNHSRHGPPEAVLLNPVKAVEAGLLQMLGVPSQNQGIDHSVSHHHHISARDYPVGCPRSSIRWFYAVDVRSPALP